MPDEGAQPSASKLEAKLHQLEDRIAQQEEVIQCLCRCAPLTHVSPKEARIIEEHLRFGEWLKENKG
jgi:uncharacterized coiled-coil protein SlyX